MNHRLVLALGEFRQTTTGEYNFCCPLCVHRVGRPDRSFHLYVNPERVVYGLRGWFYCHRCKAKGPLKNLLADKEATSAPVTEWSRFKDTLHNRFQPSEDKRPVSLPEDYVEIIEGTQAHKYLRDRGISDAQIAFYRIGFGMQDLRDVEPEERYKYAGSGRVIFPDFDSYGNCKYWVARTYKGHHVKYKNPAGSNARDQVYNLHQATAYKTCVVAEGVISALACGYNGVATYGKEVTEFQVSLLAQAGFSHYFIAHDGDAKKESLSLADRLSRRCCSVSLVCFDKDQDPASVDNIQERVNSSLSMSTKNILRFKLGL